MPNRTICLCPSSAHFLPFEKGYSVHMLSVSPGGGVFSIDIRIEIIKIYIFIISLSFFCYLLTMSHSDFVKRHALHEIEAWATVIYIQI